MNQTEYKYHCTIDAGKKQLAKLLKQHGDVRVLSGNVLGDQLLSNGWMFFFLTYEIEFVLFLAVLENSVLPLG